MVIQFHSGFGIIEIALGNPFDPPGNLDADLGKAIGMFQGPRFLNELVGFRGIP